MLSTRAEKLVYLYCNHRLLCRIQVEDYDKGRPQWIVNDNLDDDELATNVNVEEFEFLELGGCSRIQLMANLEVDDFGIVSHRRLLCSAGGGIDM